jgi:hypothetical protein
MANGNVTTTTESRGSAIALGVAETTATPSVTPPVASPGGTVSNSPSAKEINAVPSPNFAIQKGWNYLTEAGKMLVLAAFAVYSVGFLIWHTYLGQYGITPHGLLRTEFLSAAICYSILTVAFALPGAMLFDALPDFGTPGQTERFYSMLFVVWGVILQRVNSIFFPESGALMLGNAILYLFGILVIQALLEHGLKNRLSPRWLAIVKSRVWFYLWMMGIPAASLILNRNTSLLFLMMAILLVPSFKYTVPHAKIYWDEGSKGVKAMIALAVTLLALFHIHLFATFQFSKIPKSVGGGLPEQAFLKFKASDTNTAAFFGIMEDSGAFGPVKVLLHSDSEIIFIPGVDKSPTARLVRADQLAGIRYEKVRVQPE